MAENKQEGPGFDILYGSIIDRLSRIKEAGEFTPIEKTEDLEPDWDYIGTMNPDAKALWTMLEEISAFGKSLCEKIGTGDDDELIVAQNEILLERHSIIKSLFNNCLKTQVLKDLGAAGIDPSRIEIAFAEEYKIFVRQKEEYVGCPMCQPGQGISGIVLDMHILSPTKLSPEIVEKLAFSALFAGLKKKKKPEEKSEKCDSGPVENPTGQDIEN